AGLDGAEGVEDVHLAGELEGVAVAPVGVEDDRVRRREEPCLTAALVEEVDLAQLLAPPVEPDVEAEPAAAVGVEGLGDHQAVGLDRAVEAGAVAPDDE